LRTVYDSVSLLELKAPARKHLKPTSQLRNLTSSELDYLPSQEAVIKIGIFSILLFARSMILAL
jgi:hypothetical protein